MSETLLEVTGLTTTFPGEDGRVPVVDDISLSVAEGEVLALVGESGCGKSMTAFSIMRLVPKPGRIERGTVHLAGRTIHDLPVPEMRRVRGHELAMIFQEPMTSLNPVARAGDQVIEAIRLHEPVSHAEARARALALFKQVGIPDPEARLDAYPHQMSGGIKQRVMIAMALVMQPKLLIADEPTTALDVTIQAQILKLMRELQQRMRTAVLLITHDLGVVNEMADRIAVMYAGRIIELGSREQVLSRPRHPYTQGLLGSMPGRVRPGQPLAEIPGVVPVPNEWPPGCRFSTRCPRVFAPCRDIVPEETLVERGHTACCHAVAKELEA